MTRREFSIALAGSAALPVLVSGDSSPVVILTAIVGVRLPETLAIPTNSPETWRRGIWELRTYRGAESALASRLAEIFPRAGIRPLLHESHGENLTYLMPFGDLTARDQAWTAVNADPQWIRARTQFRSYHFGLYRSV
jgi:hypothetical protein